MSKHTPQGTFYTTDDLIRMAQLNQFGRYSTVLGRALVRLRQYEVENQQLKDALSQLMEQEGETIEEVYQGDNATLNVTEVDTTDENSHLLGGDLHY